MVRGLWDRETVAILLLAAILPLAVAWLLAEGWSALGRFVLVLVVIEAWQLAFMLLRAQPPSLASLATALAIAMLTPEGLGPMQMLLAISFGMVFGELAFGGWGRNVLHPATVTLAFLGFGFPAAPWPELAVQLGWAAAGAGLIGMAFGLFALPVLVGAGLVLATAVLVEPSLAPATTAFAVGLVLLAADPVASAATPSGRWANGALYAGLCILFALSWGGAAPVQIAVSAALLASIAAPLLDEIAIFLWLARRRKRLG